jgi:hypothetical protein
MAAGKTSYLHLINMSKIKKRTCPCPGGPGKPCAQFGGVVLDALSWKICNGEEVTPEEQQEFIKAMAHKHTLPPGLMKKAGNFTKALLAYIFSGRPKVDDTEYANRLSACDTCELCDKSNPEWTCTVCGCNLKEGDVLPGKARWATEDCPHPKGSRWPKNIYSSGHHNWSRPCTDCNSKGG